MYFPQANSVFVALQMQIYMYNSDDFDSLGAALREKRIISAMGVFFQVRNIPVCPKKNIINRWQVLSERTSTDLCHCLASQYKMDMLTLHAVIGVQI